MDKKYELLRVKYENSRTWLLSLIALGLSMSIAYYVVEDLFFKNKLGITSTITLAGIIFLYIIQTIRYKKLLDYLKK